MPLMLLTLYLRFGDFDFGEIKEYPKNYIHSSRFRRNFALLARSDRLECIKTTSYKKCIVCTFEMEKCTRTSPPGKNTNRKASVSSTSSDGICLLSPDETDGTDVSKQGKETSVTCSS